MARVCIIGQYLAVSDHGGRGSDVKVKVEYKHWVGGRCHTPIGHISNFSPRYSINRSGERFVVQDSFCSSDLIDLELHRG